MELTMQHTAFASFSKSIGDLKLQVHNKFEAKSWRAIDFKLHEQRRSESLVSHALPETVASIAVASIVVGAAATLLAKRNEASEADEIPMKICEDCGGSGICPECRGEGFVLKRLSEGSAEKARLTAKNAATRYTAGLPKKWSYCSKCSSSRSCLICAGRGKVII